MTQKNTLSTKEKIELLKDTITYLYEKEGRSKSYIAKVLGVNRKQLAEAINQWELVKADVRYLTPSNQKFLNKHRKEIIDRLDSDIPLTGIADAIGISRNSLARTFIASDKELLHHYNMAKDRKRIKQEQNRQNSMDCSKLDYQSDDYPDEKWVPVLGYEDYDVSNYGRIRKYAERYRSYYLLHTTKNQLSGRVYVSLYNSEHKRRNLNLARIVAHAFVDGHSQTTNTVDHIDGNFDNNRADNLEWVTQSENNRRAYTNGKEPTIAYSKHPRFKCIVVDKKYEFKTIRAVAKFLHVSESQAGRYMDGKTKTNHTFQFIYT
ncbi:MAG: NUMOD4 motif-containing HNH endonuclease [Clostridiales bacterium]|nr:NUMOD4 motif-containing HNH endonuclease [Clostridiales bacterium]